MELIKDKKELFDSYRLTTLQLKEALHNKKLTDVQSCIANRQQMVKRINRIDQMLRTMAAEVPNDKEVTSHHLNEDTGILFEEMGQLINEISMLENDCKNLAATERDLLKHELLGYQQSKRGTKGYRSGNVAPAKFIDTMIR
jgi:hypothetical protein